MTRDELCPINIYTPRGLPGEWVVLDLRGSFWIVPAASGHADITPYRGHTTALEESEPRGPLGSLFLSSLYDLDLASPARVVEVLERLETPSDRTAAVCRVLDHLPEEDAVDVLLRVPDVIDTLPREQLVSLLRSSNPQVRALALQVLGYVSGPRASGDPESPRRGSR